MNEDVINDFKQFIVATIRQEMSDVARKSDIEQLDKKIDDTRNEILEAIGDTMAANTQATDEQLDNHEQRIGKLEANIA